MGSLRLTILFFDVGLFFRFVKDTLFSGTSTGKSQKLFYLLISTHWIKKNKLESAKKTAGSLMLSLDNCLLSVALSKYGVTFIDTKNKMILKHNPVQLLAYNVKKEIPYLWDIAKHFESVITAATTIIGPLHLVRVTSKLQLKRQDELDTSYAPLLSCNKQRLWAPYMTSIGSFILFFAQNVKTFKYFLWCIFVMYKKRSWIEFKLSLISHRMDSQYFFN